MVAAGLGPRVARPSAAVVLIIWDKSVLTPPNEGFELTMPSEGWDMMKM